MGSNSLFLCGRNGIFRSLLLSQSRPLNASQAVACMDGRYLSSTARDTRVAGRSRFYKVVGVSDVSPPWESYQDLLEKKSSQKGDSIENPISAGVDGSPSGVTKSISLNDETKKATYEKMRQMLSIPGIERNGDSKWYGITLDGSLLRTPLGHIPVSVPSYPLACAIAAEWNDQNTTIQPAQMPLMTLCCTALDQAAIQPDLIVENCLRYLRNDTTCYLADPVEDRVLYRKQTKHWSPLHQWINSLFVSTDDTKGNSQKASLAIATGADEGLIMSRARRKAAGLPHPQTLIDNIEKWCQSLDAWSLTALQTVAMEAKSFSVGMAVVQGASTDGDQVPYQKETKTAVYACRVEEEFQIDNWGLVEGGHDYDRLNCSIQVHAATLLVEAITATKSNYVTTE